MTMGIRIPKDPRVAFSDDGCCPIKKKRDEQQQNTSCLTMNTSKEFSVQFLEDRIGGRNLLGRMVKLTGHKFRFEMS